MHGKHGSRALLEARFGAEGARRLIYSIIVAEVLAEELAKRRTPPTKGWLDISTAEKRIAILEEIIPLLSEGDWKDINKVIGFRIKYWNNDDEKASRS